MIVEDAVRIAKEYAEEQIKKYSEQECIWFDDGEYYITSCHHEFVLTDATLENCPEIKYCSYCGRKIKENKRPLATEEE